jgi:4'-phosphopantetheinyl transferase
VTNFGTSGVSARHLDPQVCLSTPELARYCSLDTRARADFLAGRIALKEALRRTLDAPGLILASVSVENEADGRPTFRDYPDLCCSLAHCEGWGIGAISRDPVGVDIERNRPHSADLLRYIADAREERVVAGDCRYESELIVVIWTIKEAVLKGLGEGLTVPMSAIRIQGRSGSMFMVDTGHGRDWSVEICRMHDMLLSVAWEQDGEPVHVSWYQPSRVQTTAA